MTEGYPDRDCLHVDVIKRTEQGSSAFPYRCKRCRKVFRKLPQNEYFETNIIEL